MSVVATNNSIYQILDGFNSKKMSPVGLSPISTGHPQDCVRRRPSWIPSRGPLRTTLVPTSCTVMVVGRGMQLVRSKVRVPEIPARCLAGPMKGCRCPLALYRERQYADCRQSDPERAHATVRSLTFLDENQELSDYTRDATHPIFWKQNICTLIFTTNLGHSVLLLAQPSSRVVQDHQVKLHTTPNERL